ncbi:hypothetical protein GCM10025867_28820 [Frondihabitans sucicola]|uniref:Uncharacterized protein n=1 Tax=Frondihabitans sucicola TaxID=1268041 RepID=A0ABM8GQC0_9MICO|nr:hypothetical protein GCM10025867_28820 [Frondihabitans sucicola]
MDDRELRRHALVGEVGVERLELQRRDHTLVDHGAAGQRREVRTQFTLGPLAEPERETVEVDAGGVVVAVRGGHEQLLERRHGLARQGAQLVGTHGDVAPPDNAERLLLGDGLESGLHGGALVVVDRQEADADGVVARGGQLELDDLAEEGVGHLHEDARAVSGAGVGADRASVLEVAEGTERGIDDVVTGGAAESGDHGEATGVFLLVGVVETLCRGDAAEGLVRWRESHVDPSSRVWTIQDCERAPGLVRER